MKTMPFGALKRRIPDDVAVIGHVAMKTMPFGEGKTKHKVAVGSGTKNNWVKLAA